MRRSPRISLAVLLMSLALAACGEPKTPPIDLTALEEAEIRTLAGAGDAAAKAELDRREADRALAALLAAEEAATAFQAAVASGDEGRIFDLADAGNGAALFYRAEKRLKSDMAYEQQEGFNDAEAAAAAGHADAQFWVGTRMAKGSDGYSWKPNSGLILVEKAASQGHAEAMYALAELYETGPMHDPAMARSWYQRAADAGVEKAREALAALPAPPPASDAPAN